MLDAKLIRAQPDVVRAALARRGKGEAVDALLELDARRRALLQTVEGASARRNTASKAIAEAKRAGGDAAQEIARQAALKEEEAASKAQLDEVEERIKCMLAELPNIPDETSPDGFTDEDARVVRVDEGGKPEFGFPVRDHMEIAGPDGLGLIDTERGARTSGSRFHYLLGDLVRVEFAMVQWGLELAGRHGFVPVVPPVLVREEAMFNTGFFPTDEQQVYAVTGDQLYLVGTAEVSLAALHTGETFAAEELPRRYVGFSSCFRREAGAAGRDTRGIFRVHQFDKVELFSFCHPERSREEHELILSIEEEIARALGLHYRVVDIAVGDLGASAAKKYDIEVWLPGQERYRELTSCSNTTDYQARRLGVRFRGEGGLQPVHTLNGTALTSSRTLLAIIEYGQQEDGSIAVPEVLQRYGAPSVIGREPVPAGR